MSDDAFRHLCEVCGREAMMAAAAAYADGWDYPPRMGQWGVISPRTCGACPIDATLWWAIQFGGLDVNDPLGWTEDRRTVLARFTLEMDALDDIRGARGGPVAEVGE